MTPQEAILKECAETKRILTESLINRIWRNNSTLIYSDSTEARIILDALEKQIPKKPIYYADRFNGEKIYKCPICGGLLGCKNFNIEQGQIGCARCLQMIDWSDDNE